MSHGKIYQLATKPISEDDYVSPEDFYDNHDAYADWVGDAEEGEEREECIGTLADKLKEIFTPVGGGVLVYNGKQAMKAFKQNWVDAIRQKASAITEENVTYHSPRSALRDIVDGTHLDLTERFVIEEWSGNYAEPLAELINYADEHMRKGSKLYIGAVIDFHY